MIFLTGASGFIGARLAQRLTRERGEQVTALVHRLGTVGAARLATLPNLRIVHGDIRDSAVVDEAMRGCDTVIHCAVDVSSALTEQEDVTARGTRTVLDAARKNGVRQLVFLSTAAVHDWTPAGRWDEDAPVRGTDAYSRSKIAAEAILRDNAGVPVTVIRPTCVYGPFSRTWTATPVGFLRLGIPLVASDNSGKANLIYIDNLVDLIVAAVERPVDGARVYLANEDAPADWDTLYSAYAHTIGVPLARFPADESRWRLLQEELAVSWSNGRMLAGRLLAEVKGPLIRNLTLSHRYVPLLQRADRFVPMNAMRKAFASANGTRRNGAGHAAADTAPNGIRPFAPRELRTFYSSRGTFSADRARRELGWSPRIGAAEAIDRTCRWIRDASL